MMMLEDSSGGNDVEENSYLLFRCFCRRAEEVEAARQLFGPEPSSKPSIDCKARRWHSPVGLRLVRSGLLT